MENQTITEQKQLQVRPSGEMEISDVKNQVEKIQSLMKSVMQNGQHFGTIPGTDKPTLLKPGAEKLNFMFRHIPRFEREMIDHPNGHREYIVKCSLFKFGTDELAGQGEGSCSTMESKYRYRNVADYEETGLNIPADAKEKKAEYRKQGFGMKKINGVWAWVKYKDSAKVDNPDIADTYNTVLKMADKRALVAATINACAASDIFTQDVEDFGIGDYAEAEEPRNVTEEVPKKASELPPYDRVKRYVEKARNEGYLSATMADGFMKEREEHKGDNEALEGMCVRITAQVKASKDALDKEAGKPFDTNPPPDVGKADLF